MIGFSRYKDALHWRFMFPIGRLKPEYCSRNEDIRPLRKYFFVTVKGDTLSSCTAGSVYEWRFRFGTCYANLERDENPRGTF